MTTYNQLLAEALPEAWPDKLKHQVVDIAAHVFAGYADHLEERVQGHIAVSIHRGETISRLRRDLREAKEGLGQWRSVAKQLAHAIESFGDSETVIRLVNSTKVWAAKPDRYW